jgi:hypothetical protein
MIDDVLDREDIKYHTNIIVDLEYGRSEEDRHTS